PLPAELQPALTRPRTRRFLAALAHDAVDLAARLSLHPARRQPPRRLDDRAQPDADDGARRPLARRQLDLPDLGHAAWGGAGRRPCLSPQRVLRPLRPHTAGDGARLVRDVATRLRRLAVLPLAVAGCSDAISSRHMDRQW